MILVYYLLAVNITAFILYGLDKSYAKKNKRRIPEATLLFWAWIGGSLLFFFLAYFTLYSRLQFHLPD